MFGFTELLPKCLVRLLQRRGEVLGAPGLRYLGYLVLGSSLLWFGWQLSDPAHLTAKRAASSEAVPTIGAGLFLELDSLDWQRVLPDRSAFPEAERPPVPASLQLPGADDTTELSLLPQRAVEPASMNSWEFLSRRLRSRITGPDLSPGSWDGILVHWSGTSSGDARLLDATHQSLLGEELAFHFVIGNGNGNGFGSSDGAIEIGSRWSTQAPSPLSAQGHPQIHVCLIGNSRDAMATLQQERALSELCVFLRARLGHLPVTQPTSAL